MYKKPRIGTIGIVSANDHILTAVTKIVDRMPTEIIVVDTDGQNHEVGAIDRLSNLNILKGVTNKPTSFDMAVPMPKSYRNTNRKYNGR